MLEKQLLFTILKQMLVQNRKFLKFLIINLKIFNTTVEIYPTSGFELHTVATPSSTKMILVYDCSGQGRNRDSWSMFFSEVEALIYVIDSTDIDRMSIVKENLEIILNNSSTLII